jgi:hypothetical protein
VAGDVNKSGQSKNGSIPKTLQEIEAERSRRLGAINEKRSSAHADISEAISKSKEDFAGASTSQDRLRALEEINASASLRGRINNMADENIGGQNKIMAERISTYTKERNVNERTTTMSSSAKYFKESQGSPLLSIPTEVLEQRISSGIGSINSLGQGLGESVQGTNRNLGQSFHAGARSIQEKEEEVALLKRVKSQQNRAGLSTEKIYNKFEDVFSSGKEGLDVLSNRNAVDAVKSGKHGTLEQESDKLKSTLDKLEKTFADYQESSERFASDQSDTNKKILDASLDKLKADEKAVEDQKKIVRATDVYGNRGGATGFGERLQKGAELVGSVAGSVAGMRIDDQISEVRLKAAAGQTAVTQYNRTNAAIGGDMSSLLAETSGADFRKQFSDEMRSRQVLWSGVDVGVNAAGAIGKGAVGAAEGFAKGGGKIGAAAGAIGAGAGAATAAGRQGYQLGIGLPQTTSALEANAAAEQLASVANAIPADLLQSVYNQSKGSYYNTIGAGSGADAAASTLMDNSYLKNAAAQGMSPGMAAQLTGLSISNIGGAEAGTSAALKAAKAQASGVMSAEQFIGMSGQLTGVGGGTNDLEEIMKNAVAAGMDNAKNIQQMVSATMSLSSNMAKVGIAGAEGAGNVLGRKAQQLTAGGMDPNLAMISAQSQVEIQNSMMEDRSMDIGSLYKMKELKTSFPNASTLQLNRMAGLGESELEAMFKDPELAKKQGLGSVLKSSADMEKINKINYKGAEFKAGIGIIGQTDEDNQVLRREAGITDMKYSSLGSTRKSNSEVSGQEYLKQLQTQAGREAGKIDSGGGEAMMKGITELINKLDKYLSPEKAQENVETSMKDMKAVGPVLEGAGKSLSDGAAAFSKSIDKFNQTLDAIDLSGRKAIPTGGSGNTSKGKSKGAGGTW